MALRMLLYFLLCTAPLYVPHVYAAEENRGFFIEASSLSGNRGLFCRDVALAASRPIDIGEELSIFVVPPFETSIGYEFQFLCYESADILRPSVTRKYVNGRVAFAINPRYLREMAVYGNWPKADWPTEKDIKKNIRLFQFKARESIAWLIYSKKGKHLFCITEELCGFITPIMKGDHSFDNEEERAEDQASLISVLKGFYANSRIEFEEDPAFKGDETDNYLFSPEVLPNAKAGKPYHTQVEIYGNCELAGVEIDVFPPNAFSAGPVLGKKYRSGTHRGKFYQISGTPADNVMEITVHIRGSSWCSLPLEDPRLEKIYTIKVDE